MRHVLPLPIVVGLALGVGSRRRQLIPGTDDIYQAIPAGDGNLYWRAVAPISTWSFDPGAAHPAPTTRTRACASAAP